MNVSRAPSSFESWTLPAVGTFALAVFLAVLEAVPLSRASSQLVTDLLQVGLCVAAGTACGIATARSRFLARAFWGLVTAFVVLWTLGQILWTLDYQGPAPTSFLARADLLFLAASAPLLLGLVVRPDRPRQGALGFVFDLSLLVVFGLHAYIYFTLGYLVDGGHDRYPEWVNALGNLDSMVVLVVLLWVYRTSTRSWRPTYARLALVMVMLNGGSALSSYAVLVGSYRPGLYDLPWTAPFLWLTFVALRFRTPDSIDAPARAPDFGETRSGLIVAISIIVAVPVMHLFIELASAPSQALSTLRHLLTFVATCFLAALFLARQLAQLKQTERVFVEREAYLERLFDSNPLPQFLCRRRGLEILDANLAAEGAYGYSRAELLGKSLHVLHLGKDGDPLEVAIESTTSTAGDGRVVGDWRGRTRTGATRVMELTARAIEVGAERALLVVAADVTRDRELEERLRHSQKMEALGRLAGGVAHDFNNLLTAILGYCSLLTQRPIEGGTTDFVREIESAGERAAALTKQLLAFSRKQVLVPKVVDLGAVVRDMALMLRTVLGEDIRLTIVAPDGARVEADRGQVEQVVLNLAVNARDAMPAGGEIVIEVRSAVTPPGSREVVLLTVSDTGSGMDSATASRAFEPFFTTKAVGKGTGLGLATVYGIVTQSGGSVAIDSQPGRGTRVAIELPPAEGVWAGTPSRTEVTLQLPASGTVLLVEDEEAVRNLACRVLSERGYRVLGAADAVEALEIAATVEIELDLVVTDVVMPGMKGPELVATLHDRHPDLPVLYVSGYAADSLGLGGLLDPEIPFLAKPFTAATLASRVQEVLNRAPRSA